jgi:hypothetical protein
MKTFAVPRRQRRANRTPGQRASAAQAFKDHNDFETAVCVIPDINLTDGSGSAEIELNTPREVVSSVGKRCGRDL